MIELMYVIYQDLQSNAILMETVSSARGNTSLESAVSLTKSLRWEIQNLGLRLATAASSEEALRSRGSKAQDKARNEQQLRRIIVDIRKLLSRIEDAVPLINLAITASGASLSSSLPATVSPSRLLQASTFLTAGDSQYANSPLPFVQVGPTFTLSMYMLFLGHVRPQNEDDVRESTWKEVIHKAVVKLIRVPINDLHSLPRTKVEIETNHDENSVQDGLKLRSSYDHRIEAEAKAEEYAYQLVIVEDLDDGRLHTFEEDEMQPSPYDDILTAGIREPLPIHQISKIFYADTGKILNIGTDGEANSPVLLLKRDMNAIPPRRMMERHAEDRAHEHDPRYTNGKYQSPGPSDREESPQPGAPVEDRSNNALSLSTSSSLKNIHFESQWRLPSDLDPEWIAFEVFTEGDDSGSESEPDVPLSKPTKSPRSPSLDPQLVSALSHLQIRAASASPNPASLASATPAKSTIHPTLPPIRTSLSLLEMLLRLVSLQQFQQTPHLSIPDELLTFFLSEAATTGASSSDSQERKRLRNEARRRVGFDPYDESPVKRRGEDYQYRGHEQLDHYDGREGNWNYERGGYDESESYPVPDERYGSPLRYQDEGYDTHGWSQQPPSSSSSNILRRDSTPSPRTPTPLLIQNRSQSPRSPRSGTPLRLRGGMGRGGDLAGSDREARRGSPLAKTSARILDEGLGTSPLSEGKRLAES